MRTTLIIAFTCLCACAAGKPKADESPKPLGPNDVIVLEPAIAARGLEADPKALAARFEAAALAEIKVLRVVPHAELLKALDTVGGKPNVDRSGFATTELLKQLGAGYAICGVVDKAETTGPGMLLEMITSTGDRAGEWIKGGPAELAVQIPVVLGSLLQDLGASPTGPVKYSSGLVLEMIEPGKGVRPRPTDRVKVNYDGLLADGTIFDSTKKRGEPAVFGLDRVILCWNEAMPKLRPGAKAKLTCPPNIAYGDRGQPPAIPPRSTLTFDVELLGVEK